MDGIQPPVACSGTLWQGVGELTVSAAEAPQAPDGHLLFPPDRTLPPGEKFTTTQPGSLEIQQLLQHTPALAFLYM